MEDYPQSLIHGLGLKCMASDKKGTSQTAAGGHGCRKAQVVLQIVRRRMMEKQRKKRRAHGAIRGSRRPKIMMQRKAVLEGSRRPLNSLEGSLDALQRLVPNGECMELDALFSEAADYIVGLQNTVKVMQIMSYGIPNL
ncbi:Transcription factor [Nymphaea thermarum]|nr:Transcription factor [Nymphaea thermarum]